MTSTRPYLLRAFYEWIVDNQMTPYVVIDAQAKQVNVPAQFVEDGRIVLNVSPHATKELIMSNESLAFSASFSGDVHYISAPTQAILAIYAKENGRGMVFGEDDEDDEEDNGDGDDTPPTSTDDDDRHGGKKPKLRVVK